MIASAPARHLVVGALVAGLLVLAGGAMAQPVELPAGIGTTPVITPVPVMPMVTPSLTTPSLTPIVTPTLAPPATFNPTVAPPIAAPVARSVRFRCEVLPQDQSCREHSEAPDGDAHDDRCDCNQDLCYPAADGNRVCEKLQ